MNSNFPMAIIISYDGKKILEVLRMYRKMTPEQAFQWIKKNYKFNHIDDNKVRAIVWMNKEGTECKHYTITRNKNNYSCAIGKIVSAKLHIPTNIISFILG